VQDGVDRAGHVQVVGHVPAEQSEPRIVEQVGDVGRRAGEEVVNAQHLTAVLEHPLAQVRAEEAGATGHYDPP
jgi:hypothetical protein